MSDTQLTRRSVAVIGAAGHTGQFIVRELLRREITPIAIARSTESLRNAAFPSDRVLCRPAVLDDETSLHSSLAGADVVINCAGPFLETSHIAAAAAIRSGIHYLDISAEQQSVKSIFEKYDSAAITAGIALVPAMGFFGGFADLLVTAAMGDWEEADNIDVMIGLDSWHPTRGTRITGHRNTATRMVIRHGSLSPVQSPAREREWHFAAPIGPQSMIKLPFSEVILIARHLKTNELHTWLNRKALSDVRNPATPTPQSVDAIGRSAQRFTVEIEIQRNGISRQVKACGQDIYAFSAPLVCEAAARLLQGANKGVGAQPPAAIFDAGELLASLTPEYLILETVEEWFPASSTARPIASGLRQA